MKRVAVEVIILKEYPKRTARFFPGDNVWVTAKFADELEASGQSVDVNRSDNLGRLAKRQIPIGRGLPRGLAVRRCDDKRARILNVSFDAKSTEASVGVVAQRPF